MGRGKEGGVGEREGMGEEEKERRKEGGEGRGRHGRRGKMGEVKGGKREGDDGTGKERKRRRARITKNLGRKREGSGKGLRDGREGVRGRSVLQASRESTSLPCCLPGVGVSGGPAGGTPDAGNNDPFAAAELRTDRLPCLLISNPISVFSSSLLP